MSGVHCYKTLKHDANAEWHVKLPPEYYTLEEWLKANPPEQPAPLTLEEMQILARQSLREKRKQIEYGGFSLDGQRWDSTEKDELRLNSVMKIFEAGISAYDGWKIAEDTYITLTPEIVRRAAMALMEHYGKCFSIEKIKLGQLSRLDSSEAIMAWIETELNKGW